MNGTKIKIRPILILTGIVILPHTLSGIEIKGQKHTGQYEASSDEPHHEGIRQMFKPPDPAHICFNPINLVKNMNRLFTTDAGFAHQRAD